MRSYEAARSYFSFLAFVSWCVIALGGILALVAMVAVSEANQRFGGSAGIILFATSVFPGSALAFAGFIGLVLAQIGRAGVDSAEYAQQSLQVSREHLEISKQALRQGRAEPAGFKSLTQDGGQHGSPSFASLNSSETGSPAPEDKQIETALSEAEGKTYDINGQKLTQLADGTFVLDNQTFTSIEAVKDHLRINSMSTTFGGNRS